MLITKLEVVVVVVVAEKGKIKISYHLPLAELCQLPTAKHNMAAE